MKLSDLLNRIEKTNILYEKMKRLTYFFFAITITLMMMVCLLMWQIQVASRNFMVSAATFHQNARSETFQILMIQRKLETEDKYVAQDEWFFDRAAPGVRNQTKKYNAGYFYGD